jgi:hypothetical protein
MSACSVNERSRLTLGFGLVLAFALLSAGCTQQQNGSGAAGGSAENSSTASTQPPAAVADSAKAVEKRIVAAKGGSLDLKPDSGTAVRVVFPQDALGKDQTLVISPLTQAPAAKADVVDNGFRLQTKGVGAGPALRYPAFVTFAVAEKVATDTAIVRWADDGTYEVLPTKVYPGEKRSILTAITTHFSDLGLGKGKSKSAKKARDKYEDFDWVVYINDTQKIQNGPMRQSVKLNLRAVNTGGDIPGQYTGNATIKSTNDMSSGGGKLNATFSGKSTSVQIHIGSPDDLAPLTDDSPAPLAPLLPQVNWSGTGLIKMSAMSAKGIGTIQAGGYGGSRALSNTSSLPVNIDIKGPQVTLKVATPAGALSFAGYIRGEGKR